MRPVAEQKMQPCPYPFIPISSDTLSESSLYDPPIEEFAVIRTVLQKGGVQFTGIFGPSIIIFTKGSGVIKGGGGGKKIIQVIPGTIIFVGAGLHIEIEGEGMELYRAFCSVQEGQSML